MGVYSCWYGEVRHSARHSKAHTTHPARPPSKRPTSPAVHALARAAPLGASGTGPLPPRLETVSSALARPPPAARVVSSPRLILPNTPICSQRPAAAICSLPALHRPRAQAHQAHQAHHARSRLTLSRARSSRLSPSRPRTPSRIPPPHVRLPPSDPPAPATAGPRYPLLYLAASPYLTRSLTPALPSFRRVSAASSPSLPRPRTDLVVVPAASSAPPRRTSNRPSLRRALCDAFTKPNLIAATFTKHSPPSPHLTSPPSRSAPARVRHSVPCLTATRLPPCPPSTPHSTRRP